MLCSHGKTPLDAPSAESSRLEVRRSVPDTQIIMAKGLTFQENVTQQQHERYGGREPKAQDHAALAWKGWSRASWVNFRCQGDNHDDTTVIEREKGRRELVTVRLPLPDRGEPLSLNTAAVSDAVAAGEVRTAAGFRVAGERSACRREGNSKSS